MMMDKRYQRRDVFAALDVICIDIEKGIRLITANFLFLRLRNHRQSSAQLLQRYWTNFNRCPRFAAPERPEQVVELHESLDLTSAPVAGHHS